MTSRNTSAYGVCRCQALHDIHFVLVLFFAVGFHHRACAVIGRRRRHHVIPSILPDY
jgi:hypothetical protein